MHRIAIGVAFSSILMACPALAQEKGFYLGVDVGSAIAFETDQTYTPATVALTTGTISTDHEMGLTGSVFAGYDFGSLRIEAEAGQVSAKLDKATTSFPIGTLAAGTYDAEGKIGARTAMVNVLVDIGDVNGFAFFAGGGAGVAQVKVSAMRVSSSPTLLDDTDPEWRSAWQGIVGVRKPLTERIDAHVRYIYFNVDDVEVTGWGGRAVTAGLKSQSVVGGITYRF